MTNRQQCIVNPIVNPKVLFVEGHDDLYAIIELMKRHTSERWEGKDPAQYPVQVIPCGNVEAIRDEDKLIKTTLQIKTVTTVGVVIDGDQDCGKQWNLLRATGLKAVQNLPDKIPTTGLIRDFQHQGRDKRLGVWLMPDNKSTGMLETFLRYLVPSQQDALWKQAQTCVCDAVASGARCREPHIDKANIYTWLAWQDPPTPSFGRAIQQKVFDPHAPYAAPFVTWFTTLFQISRSDPLFAERQTESAPA